MDIGHRIIPGSIYSFLEFPATDSKFNPIDRFASTDTPDCSNPPQRKGEDRIGEVAVREIFRKKNIRGRSSAHLPRHLKEFSIFRLRAEDLLKLD